MPVTPFNIVLMMTEGIYVNYYDLQTDQIFFYQIVQKFPFRYSKWCFDIFLPKQ